MAVALEDIKSRLSYLGYTEQGSEDPALNYLISEVEAEIKNKCNITVIPEELDKVEIDMICGRFLREKFLTGTLGSYSFASAAKALTEGDVTVTFSDDDSPEAKFKALLDWLATHGEDQLITFRRLRW